MSVRERIEELEEEMEALFPPKIEIKTLREWLAEDGYVPPANPSDVSAELRTFIDRLASLDIVVLADRASDREVYPWLCKQLGAHVTLTPGRIVYFDMNGDVAAARNPRED
jgi:hypothetical protein